VSDGYLLANDQADAGERLAALAELFDPVTFRHLDRLGVGPGWSCWEVGAGGPGVATWLAARTGPGGRVLATDIDVSRLPADGPFEVRRHDVSVDPPPTGPFDLVHARLVLVHLPRRHEALAALVSVLRPGGWLVVEDADPALQPRLCPDEAGPAEALANRLRDGFRTLLAARGAELAFGRTVPRLLRTAGLRDVGADAWFPVAGPACTALERTTIGQIRAGLVEAGLATDEEIDTHLANLAGGTMDLTTAPLISAWGRTPP